MKLDEESWSGGLSICLIYGCIYSSCLSICSVSSLALWLLCFFLAFAAFVASRLLLLLCFYGFCGFWFLRPLGLFWLFTSEFICMCLWEEFTQLFSTCPNLPFWKFWKPYFRTLVEIILQLYLYTVLYLSCVSQRLHGCHDSVSTCVPYCSTRCILCSISIHPECHIQHCMGEQVEFFCFGGRHMYVYIYVCIYTYLHLW